MECGLIVDVRTPREAWNAVICEYVRTDFDVEFYSKLKTLCNKNCDKGITHLTMGELEEHNIDMAAFFDMIETDNLDKACIVNPTYPNNDKVKTDSGFIKWDETPSWAGGDEVRVGFRCLNTVKKDHILNYTAAALTTTPVDMYRGGRYGNMCHCELFHRVNDKIWTRSSIYLKTMDPETGKLVPATWHCKVTDSSAWDSKYEFVCLNVPRAAQTKAMKFLSTQGGVPFNHKSYYYNILGADFGTRSFTPELLHEKAEGWYCTEGITAALQAMASHPSVKRRVSWQKRHGVADLHWSEVVNGMACNHTNPNSLYRALRPLSGVMPALPPDENFTLDLD